jgi:hypothetical protein
MRGCLVWLGVNSIPLWWIFQFVPGISYTGSPFYLVVLGLIIGLINLPLLLYLAAFTASPAELRRRGAEFIAEHPWPPYAKLMAWLTYFAINAFLFYGVAWLASRLNLGLSVNSLGAISGGLTISVGNGLMLVMHQRAEDKLPHPIKTPRHQ